MGLSTELRSSKKKLKIAVIDSGLCEKHSRMKDLRILKRVAITEDGIGDNTTDLWGHGTACTYIIKNVLKEDLKFKKCDFIIVKIFDKGLVIKEQVLIDALKWCICAGVDVINMSLGLAGYDPSVRLANICREAYEKGIIIVAADHNESGEACYPAYFPFVFGVTSGVIKSKTDYGVIENSPIEFIGRGTKQRIAWINGGYVFDGSTSYATAQLTGIVCNTKYEHPDWSPQEVKDYLLKTGKKNIQRIGKSFSKSDLNMGNPVVIQSDKIESVLNQYFNLEKRFEWMNNIGVYPFSNKEMQGFKYFLDLCPFEIKEIFDYPKSVVENRTVKLGGVQLKKKWIVENSSSCLDTFVIGYPYETPFETNHHFFHQLVDYLISNGLNSFCLDQEIANEIGRIKKDRQIKSGVVYVPKIEASDTHTIEALQYLGPVTKPVLSVIGTNSRQGKFSAQLRIKQILKREGYKVGWLSTEPQGELFGADFSFPYGFNGTVNIGLDAWPNTISCAIKGIEVVSNPDIIITGHQSGLLPVTRSNFLRNKLNHLTFLSGVQPDAAACVVSPEDTLEVVKDVLSVVKHLFRIPVLFLILAPSKRTPVPLKNRGTYIRFDLLNKEEWATHAAELESALNLPVINAIAEDHVEKILSSIENYFGKEA